MPQILAWKCSEDGKLFEDKSKYQKHLRKLAAVRLQDRKVKKMEEDRKEFLKKMGQEVGSFDELEKFIKDNWDFFFANGLSHQFDYKKASIKKHEYVEVAFRHPNFNANCSNSHSCPQNGVTNWHRASDKPTGYAGWRTQINIHVRTHQKKYRGEAYYQDGFGSEYFAGTPICTGGGGGGGVKIGVTSYSYDCTIWADDFPKMYYNQKADEMVEILQGA
jgi:hypothetical protein